MKTIRSITICLGWFVLATLAMTSCDKYDFTDKLQGLGERVEALELKADSLNQAFINLNAIIETIRNNGYVTRLEQNPDGSYTITLSTGNTITLRNGHKGSDGADGQEATLLISAKQDIDGQWYWTLNGEWMLDATSNKIPAGGKDGKDGQDGKDDNAIVPRVRIDNITRCWQISTDNGVTWDYILDGNNQPIRADGKNGADGADDLFKDIIVSDDGKSITIVLTDDRTFTIPIIPRK